MKSLFLSHSHADKGFARKLAASLRDRSAYVWLDEAEIKVGDSLIEKIRDGIDRVDYFGVVLSSASVKSEWVSKELDLAMNEEISGCRVKVLPLLLEDCELPSFLVGKRFADFRSDYDSGLGALIGRLGLDTLATPHQPLLRSVEIPIPALSDDCMPQLGVAANELLVQWTEQQRVYIYVFDRSALTLVSAIAYDLPGEIYGSFLPASESGVGSFAVATEDWQEFSLWYLAPQSPSSEGPKKVEGITTAVSSIAPCPGGFLASFFAHGALSITEVASNGVRVRSGSRDYSLDIPQSYVVPFSGGAQVVLRTSEGIAVAAASPTLSLDEMHVIIPEKRKMGSLQDAKLNIYDNCCHRVGDSLATLTYDAEREELLLSEVRPPGRESRARRLPVPSDRPFKQSMAVDGERVLALWHEHNPEGWHHVHSCMLFKRENLRPLWPYERVLTGRSNCATGTPATIYGDIAYVVYLEELEGRFKVKVTEIDLRTTEPPKPTVLRWD